MIPGALARTGGGHLATTTGGHLGTIAFDPSMLVTITGASGAIRWCGELWNLPGDSGVQKEVCPTTYYNRQIGPTASISLRGTHFWRHRYDACEQLVLHRAFIYYTYASWRKAHNRLIVKDFTDHYVWYNTAHDFTGTLASDLNIVLTVARPLQSDYQLTNEFFGSHVISGITYSWEKGEGW